MSARKWLNKIGFALAVFVMMTPAVSVFLWMLSLSLKNEIDNLAYPPVFVPSPPTFANFRAVFQQNPFALYFWNSIVVSGLATLTALAVGVPAGYGIARLRAKKLLVLTLSLMDTILQAVDRARSALIAAGLITRERSWRNL